MIYRSILALIFWTGMAMAQTVPGLFAIQDVAADDTLNIRSAPGSTSPIVGELAYNAKGIEVSALSDDRKWGRMNTSEWTGWVSMRYMTQTYSPTGLPSQMTCFGTEPFWSLKNQGNALAFDQLGLTPQLLSLIDSAATSGRPDRFAFLAEGAGGQYTGVLRKVEACSDGMSDRLYGYDIDLIDGSDNAVLSFAGCCTLMVN